jgi:hypothetical protein
VRRVLLLLGNPIASEKQAFFYEHVNGDQTHPSSTVTAFFANRPLMKWILYISLEQKSQSLRRLSVNSLF